MRAIDADAIEYTHAVARNLFDGHNWNELVVTKDEIEDMPTIQPEQHWIPVEQDLPKENYLDDGYVEPSQPVLVYMSYHTCKISRYWGHRKSKGTSDYVIPDWMDLEDYDGDNVIAWMPLPEPYKGVNT